MSTLQTEERQTLEKLEEQDGRELGYTSAKSPAVLAAGLLRPPLQLVFCLRCYSA